MTPGPVSDSYCGPVGRDDLLPPWPEECGILLADGTPRRCLRLIAGTAGDPRRDAEHPHRACGLCGQTYLARDGRAAAWNAAFAGHTPLIESPDRDVVADARAAYSAAAPAPEGDHA